MPRPRPMTNRRPLFAKLNLQQLERRDTPAPVATTALSGTTLTITGVNGKIAADSNQQFEISGDGLGQIFVTGVGATTITGKNSFTNVKAITLNLNDGDDLATFKLGSALTSLTGPVTINPGNGNDQIVIQGGSHFRGAVTINDTNGNDTVQFGGDNSAITVTGKLDIKLGAGINTTVLGASTGDAVSLGSLGYTGTTGIDVVQSSAMSLTVLGATTMNVGAGNNSVSLTALTNQFAGFTFTGGTNADSVTIGRADEFATVTMQAAAFTLGAGTNDVQFPAGSTTLNSLAYTGGSGNDSLIVGTDAYLNSFRVNTTTSVRMDAGTNLARFGSTQNLTLVGTTTVTNATGFDTVEFGRADATVSLAGVTINNAAGGSDTKFLGGTIALNSPLSVIAASGIDTVTFGGAASNTTTKNLTLNLGANAGNVNFGGETFKATSTTTSPPINLSGTGGQSIRFLPGVEATIIGKFQTMFGAEADLIDSTGAQVRFEGIVDIQTGGGNDQVIIDGGTFLVDVSVKSGDGLDKITLTNGDFQSTTKKVFVDSGNHDDQVTVGGVYRFAVEVLLGAGNDTGTLKGLTPHASAPATTLVTVNGLAGNDTMVVNGGSKITNLLASGGADTDKVYFGGDGSFNRVIGNFTFDCGGGEENSVYLGTVAGDETKLKNVLLTGSTLGIGLYAAGESVEITDPLEFTIGAYIKGISFESESITLSHLNMKASTYGLYMGLLLGKSAGSTLTAGNITFNNPSGRSEVFFDAETSTIASLNVVSNSQAEWDEVEVGDYGFAKSFHVLGAVSVDHGSGPLSHVILLPSESLVIDGMTTFKGLEGNNTFSAGALDGAATLNGLTLQFGNGGSSIWFYGDTTNNGNFALTAGTGYDMLSAYGDTNFINKGNVTMSLGAGGSWIGFTPQNLVQIDGSVSITAEAGTDEIRFGLEGETKTGPITIDLGAGRSDFSFQASDATVTGDLTIKGRASNGPSESYLGMTKADIFGDITFTGSTTGSNAFIAAYDLTIVGSIFYTGGSGSDRFEIGQFAQSESVLGGIVTVQAGAGANEIELTYTRVLGNFTVAAGNGADSWSASGCEFEMPVDVVLGLGDDQFSADSTTFRDFLGVQLGNDQIGPVIGSDTDLLSFVNCRFDMSMIAGLGDGFNEITINSSTIYGFFNVVMGNGADFVSLSELFIKSGGEVLIDSRAGVDAFVVQNIEVDTNASAALLAGDDPDVLQLTWDIGGGPGSLSILLQAGDDDFSFFGYIDPILPILVHGGSGNDSTNLTEDDPLISGFELFA